MVFRPYGTFGSILRQWIYYICHYGLLIAGWAVSIGAKVEEVEIRDQCDGQLRWHLVGDLSFSPNTTAMEGGWVDVSK